MTALVSAVVVLLLGAGGGESVSHWVSDRDRDVDWDGVYVVCAAGGVYVCCGAAGGGGGANTGEHASAGRRIGDRDSQGYQVSRRPGFGRPDPMKSGIFGISLDIVGMCVQSVQILQRRQICVP